MAALGFFAAAAMDVKTLLEEAFEVRGVNVDGKPFDKVSRLKARTEISDIELALDVHNELFPVEIGQKFSLVLSYTLDGTPSEGFNQSNKKSLADSFDYVMYGRVYKYEEDKQAKKVSVYVSFGGLLMMLKGEEVYLKSIELGKNIYLLMRRT